MSFFKKLVSAIKTGENTKALSYARKLIKLGVAPEEIINGGVTPALEELDEKCRIEQLSLVEILLAGRAMKDVVEKVVKPEIEAQKIKANEIYTINKAEIEQITVILGTIKGDIHDLGKQIVETLFTTVGYNVIDIGKDVPPDIFIQEAVANQAQIIGVSSLITTTIPEIREIRRKAIEQGVERLKIIAGGAAINQLSPVDLNVDYVAKDVFDALNYLKDIQEEI